MFHCFIFFHQNPTNWFNFLGILFINIIISWYCITADDTDVIEKKNLDHAGGWIPAVNYVAPNFLSLRECQGCLGATGLNSECLLSMPRAEVLPQPQMKPCPRHSLMFQENKANHLLLMLTKLHQNQLETTHPQWWISNYWI